MAVARSDEGSSSYGTGMARRRMIRKPMDGGAPPPPSSAAPAAPSAASSAPSSGPAGSTRLDDLYRLPMPKLFAYAEREGIHEHTGMNRGQLIIGIVRPDRTRRPGARLRH